MQKKFKEKEKKSTTKKVKKREKKKGSSWGYGHYIIYGERKDEGKNSSPKEKWQNPKILCVFIIRCYTVSEVFLAVTPPHPPPPLPSFIVVIIVENIHENRDLFARGSCLMG